ncbi:phage terminase small subunit [Bacterioplanoides sp.]|uniref:phage terminase small subunit n=1 Tax=Bacterioplanoides sp. TaxID=2066072 RepID=UPI003B5A1B41
MTSIAMQFKDAAVARKKAEKKDQLAAEYEADTIRQTAEDYDQFQLLVNSLETDLKRLSGLSPGDKDKLKQDELIPKYISVAQKYIEEGESYRNPVLVEVIIMMLDVGQIPEAMAFVDCAIEQKQPMPERFKKTNLPTFIADSVLHWANAQIARDKPHDPEFSQTFEAMVEDGWKVPRELIGKYHKLAGDVDLSNKQFKNALEHFTRAMEIDPVGSKCTTKINQIKKKLD